jgi:methionyl-tRNA formyltransferase
MKICIAGKNDIGAKVLHFAVQLLGAKEVVVVPNSDDSGRHTWQKSLRQTAIELGVREMSLEDIYKIEDILFLSVEYNNIIKPELFKTKRLINIHFSKLPKYKGMYTSIWPILNGESESGVTLHRIDKGIDTGQIIAQSTFPILPDDASRDVYFNYMHAGFNIIVDNFEKLLRNDFEAFPQPAAGSTYYSKKSINYSDLKINFWATAQQIHNYVRGFSFYEYQLLKIFGSVVRKSEITADSSKDKPGVIVYEDDKCIIVNTVDYNICLYKDYSLQLFEYVQAGDAEKVNEIALLVDNVDVTNRQGWSPLMIAAYNNDLPIVMALLKAGANINSSNKKGTTVLMYAKAGAIRTNELHTLKYLLMQGADYTAVDITGKSVLDYARVEDNADVVNCLENQNK